MPIFNKMVPAEMYDETVPPGINAFKDAVGLICAKQQKFVNYSKKTLNLQTSNYYFKNDPLYQRASPKNSLIAPISS